MPILLEWIYLPPIVVSPFYSMGYILSMNMSYSDQMGAFLELSNMKIDPSESNKIWSMYSTI